MLLKDCMYKNNKETNDEDGDDGVKDLIEMTMKKMDQDRDGRVSFSDFHETVKKVIHCHNSSLLKIFSMFQEPLMMEAFGSCLPTSKEGKEFVHKILDTKPCNSLLFDE